MDRRYAGFELAEESERLKRPPTRHLARQIAAVYSNASNVEVALQNMLANEQQRWAVLLKKSIAITSSQVL